MSLRLPNIRLFAIKMELLWMLIVTQFLLAREVCWYFLRSTTFHIFISILGIAGITFALVIGVGLFIATVVLCYKNGDLQRKLDSVGKEKEIAMYGLDEEEEA